jgi:hypothetical protein
MRSHILTVAMLAAIIFPVAVLADNPALAQNPANINSVTTDTAPSNSGSSINDNDYNLYAFVMQDYYKVPINDIATIKQKGVSAEEIPVVLFFVKNAKVTIDQVMEHRQRGEKWVNIAEALDIKPAMLFMPIKEEVTQSHFSRAYGYFKTKQLKSWKWVNLDDEDFVNLVNLKFLARHYDAPAFDIIKQRETGATYISMNVELNDRKYRANNEKELKSAWKK